MKLFNNPIWLFAFLSLSMFFSCEKEDAISPGVDEIPSTAPANELDYRAVRTVLLSALEQAPVRNFLKKEASKRYTYDYEVIYGMVKADKLSTGQTFEATLKDVEFNLIKAGKLNAPIMDKVATAYPLLSINIPIGLANWDADNYTLPVAVNPEDNLLNGIAKAIYANGKTVSIDPQNPDISGLIVIQDNERMVYENGRYFMKSNLILSVAPKITGYGSGAKNLQELECFNIPGEPDQECVVWTGGNPGNPPPTSGGNTNCRGEDEWDMSIIMRGIRMENVSSFETFGRPELRLRVFGGVSNTFLNQPQGGLVVDGLWTPRRSDVNQEWTDENDHLEYWVEAYGDQLTFRWDEEDGGDNEDINFSFSVSYGDQTFGVNADFPRARRDDYIGRTRIYKTRCERQFNVGSALRFRLTF